MIILSSIDLPAECQDRPSAEGLGDGPLVALKIAKSSLASALNFR
jgi:hypothetical protein